MWTEQMFVDAQLHVNLFAIYFEFVMKVVFIIRDIYSSPFPVPTSTIS